ncbi:MAG: haloacid dehalogenase-like hydrolase [Acidobacteria bacterium]|nr:haloacid dehalogenase-like hydrolase [Acidobacteriota bacterium]
MKLVIFDIDGTLTQTSRVDAICFARALAEIHAINVDEADWVDCPHVSDTGVTHYLFQQRFGRAPQGHEEQMIKERLVRLLEEHHELDRSYFAEVPGAMGMLNRLKQKRDWFRAIATGCWQPSAEMKLRAASLDYEGVPGGFAEDGVARETIVSAAISRSISYYQRECFDRIVSIGDGVWDVRTAANLGLAFVGIARGARAEALSEAGAKQIIPDFEDQDHFFALLEKAEVPGV